MTIERRAAQRQMFWDFVILQPRDHQEAGLEPTAVRLKIELAGPCGDEACAVVGGARLGLGEVRMAFLERR